MGRYEIGRLLSSGMIGVVFLARDLYVFPLMPVVLKKLYYESIMKKGLSSWIKNELEIITKVNDIEGCVKCLDLTINRNSLSIVMSYYPDGDLSTFIKRNYKYRILPEKHARSIFV